MMRFCTIASGSSGNAYYLGIAGQHFLIDAGISGKRIENALFQMNIRSLSGIFITHEHRDHITGAGVIARRFKAGVYATPLTWRYFLRHGTLGPLNEEQVRFIEPGKTVIIGAAEVAAFDVPHDASQPVGYTFQDLAVQSRKMAFATDLGFASETVKERLRGAKCLLLESNHDTEMLGKCRYHSHLKARVSGNMGHLSNVQAGALLSEVAVSGQTFVFLAHLSEESNTPMLAFDTVKRVLDGNNIKIAGLAVAERHCPGEMVSFG